MGKKSNIYRRLPGRGGQLVFNVILYQGPDHLLQVLSTGFNETYKRFYYRDIQAITLRKTHLGKVWNGVWGVLAALLALAAYFAGGAAAVVFGILAGVFLVLLGINLVFGPTVTSHLRTAVQVEKLPSLGRLRSARSTLRILNPLIASAQGRFPAEVVKDESAAGPSAPSPPPAPTPPGPGENPETPPVISDPV